MISPNCLLFHAPTHGAAAPPAAVNLPFNAAGRSTYRRCQAAARRAAFWADDGFGRGSPPRQHRDGTTGMFIRMTFSQVLHTNHSIRTEGGSKRPPEHTRGWLHFGSGQTWDMVVPVHVHSFSLQALGTRAMPDRGSALNAAAVAIMPAAWRHGMSSTPLAPELRCCSRVQRAGRSPGAHVAGSSSPHQALLPVPLHRRCLCQAQNLLRRETTPVRI